MACSRKRKELRIAPGKKPPESFVFNGVPLELEKTAYNPTEKITHFIYRSRRSGWLISFSDRQLMAGIDLVSSAHASGILTGISAKPSWRD